MPDAPDTVEESRDGQLGPLEEEVVAFTVGYLAALAGRPDTAIGPVWAEQAYARLGPHFTDEAIRQTLATAVATGISPGTIRAGLVEQLAAEHLAGFARYGDHVADEVAKLRGDMAAGPTAPHGSGSHTPADGAARRSPGDSGADPGGSGDASPVVREVLNPDRVLQVAGAAQVHMQNGATAVALHNGEPPPAGPSTREFGDGGGATAPEDMHGAKFDRTKQWQTMRDARVRPAHRAAQGQTVPTSGVFDIAGHWARYPGDPELPPGLRFGCRCFIVPGGHDADEWLDRVRALRLKVVFDDDGAGSLDGERLADDGGPLTASGRPSTLGRMQLATEGPDYSTGIMVCVTPNAAESSALVLEGGCSVDELHCTLGYFGNTDDHADPTEAAPDDLRSMLQAACFDAAATVEPGILSGTISGCAVFTANPDLPLIALPDVPGLSTLREAMVAALPEMARSALFTNHGWCPHITLAYAAEPEDLAAAIVTATGLPVTFDAIELVYGEEHYRYPFGAVQEEPPMRPTPPSIETAGKPQPFTVAHKDEHGVVRYRRATGYFSATNSWSSGAAGATIRDAGIGELVGAGAVAIDGSGRAVRANVFTESVFDITDSDEDPDAYRSGDVILISDTEAVGIIAEIQTTGTAEGPAGPIEASEAAPLYIVEICVVDEHGVPQPTGDTVAVTVDMIERIPEADGDLAAGDEIDPVEVEQAMVIAPTGIGILAAEMDPRAGPLNQERAARGDWEWEGLIVPEGRDTGDGRFIVPGALGVRVLPLTLMAMFQNPETEGHALALCGGSMWQMERVGGTFGPDIVSRGFFDSGIAGRELRRMMAEGTIKGVSADLDLIRSEIWYDEMTDQEKLVVSMARIMGATACNFPAFQEAVLYLTVVAEPDVAAIVASAQFVWRMEAHGLVEWWTPTAGSALVASARGPEDLPWIDAGGARQLAEFVGGGRHA